MSLAKLNSYLVEHLTVEPNCSLTEKVYESDISNIQKDQIAEQVLKSLKSWYEYNHRTIKDYMKYLKNSKGVPESLAIFNNKWALRERAERVNVSINMVYATVQRIYNNQEISVEEYAHLAKFTNELQEDNLFLKSLLAQTMIVFLQENKEFEVKIKQFIEAIRKINKEEEEKEKLGESESESVAEVAVVTVAKLKDSKCVIM